MPLMVCAATGKKRPVQHSKSRKNNLQSVRSCMLMTKEFPAKLHQAMLVNVHPGGPVPVLVLMRSFALAVIGCQCVTGVMLVLSMWLCCLLQANKRGCQSVDVCFAGLLQVFRWRVACGLFKILIEGRLGVKTRIIGQG
jgi:hypothetical protein